MVNEMKGADDGRAVYYSGGKLGTDLTLPQLEVERKDIAKGLKVSLSQVDISISRLVKSGLLPRNLRKKVRQA